SSSFLRLALSIGASNETVVLSKTPTTSLDNELRRLLSLLAEHVGNNYCVGIDPAHDSPGVLPIRDAKLDAARSDRGHGSSLRKTQALAALQTSQQESRIQPRTCRERRRLYLGA